MTVRDNKAQGRFELDVEETVAFANYRLTPLAVIITHTETHRGRCAAAASLPNWSRAPLS